MFSRNTITVISYVLFSISCTSCISADLKRAQDLARNEKYEEAADLYWHLIMNNQDGEHGDYDKLFADFMQTFNARNIPEEGYIYVANQYINFKQKEQGIIYLNKAVEMNPKSVEAHLLLGEHLGKETQNELNTKVSHLAKALELEPNNAKVVM